MKDILVAITLSAYLIVTFVMTKNPLDLRSSELGVLLQLVGASSASAVVATSCAVAPRVPISDNILSISLATLLVSSFVGRAATQVAVRDAPFWIDVWDNVMLISSLLSLFYISYVAMVPRHFLRLAIMITSVLVVSPILLVSDIDPDTKADEMTLAALKHCQESYKYVKGKTKTCSDKSLAIAAFLATGEELSFCEGDGRIVDTERTVFKLDKGVLYIAFAGSSLASDWVTNARVRSELVSLPGFEGTLVHAGFGRLFNSIIEEDNASKKIIGKNGILYRNLFLHDLGAKSIVVCGHSLGGALAVLASYYISKRTTTPVHCITFGAPQVGDKSFVRKFNSSVTTSVRVVNPYDIVPYSFSAKYNHVRGKVVVVAPLLMNIMPTSHKLPAYNLALIDDGPISWPALTFLGVLVVFYVIYSPYL